MVKKLVNVLGILYRPKVLKLNYLEGICDSTFQHIGLRLFRTIDYDVFLLTRN